MEENKDNVKTPDAVVDKSGKEFKAVKQLEKKQKGKSNFGKSVAVPFLSGVLGATLVLGTCLGVTEIRSNIIGFCFMMFTKQLFSLTPQYICWICSIYHIGILQINTFKSTYYSM